MKKQRLANPLHADHGGRKCPPWRMVRRSAAKKSWSTCRIPYIRSENGVQKGKVLH